jgi:hypoxanthine phosphoribosyltransferase
MSQQFDERQFRPYMEAKEISSVVDLLAEKINTDYGINDRIVLVGVLKGATMVMADLVRRLHADVDVDFVRFANHGKTLNSPGTITFMKDISVDMRGKHIIIVEEIIDSGRTLKFLYDRLKSTGALSVKIATLMDKRQKRMSGLEADYVGRVVDDQFLIGYGLDLEEKCRNLPDIYALKYPN